MNINDLIVSISDLLSQQSIAYLEYYLIFNDFSDFFGNHVTESERGGEEGEGVKQQVKRGHATMPNWSN